MTTESGSSAQRPRGPLLLATVFGLIGLVLLAGGARLATLGGSLYYVVAGVALLIVAVLLARRSPWGARLYALLTLGTIVWALAEVGFDGWALAPRVLPYVVLGAFLLRGRVRRSLANGEPQPVAKSPFTWAFVAAFVIVCVGVASREPYPAAPFPGEVGQVAQSTSADWSHWGRTAAGTRYAPFTQINSDNVRDLKVAWTYRTGVSGAFKATPLQVGELVYVCLAGNIIVALDVDTGARQWRFDPKIKDPKVGFSTTCRGLTYFKSPDERGECAERILTATTDARLVAVDARTGERCMSFGERGEVNLLVGMGDVKPGFYYVTSPPTIVRGVAVLGGWVADNVEVEEPSGVIRGFDVLTGELRWAWDLGRTEVLTALPQGDTYTRGTPNAWSVFSGDEALGLVYIPTGNATPDYYGGHRSPQSEQYASSVVALDAESGVMRWSFQTTHHDLWDYDVPAQPVLIDLPAAQGGVTPALVAPTKRGELFLLDRQTGEPLAEVQELPVPQTDVPDEWTSKTQPFSIGMPAFGREPVTEAKMWGVTPLDQMWCRIEFRKLRYDGPLTPPALRGSIQHPGFAGGMNWGSVAIDEANHVMIVNTLQIANRVQLYPRAEVTENTPRGFGGGWQHGTPYAARTDPFLSPLFAPCQQPPYGEIAAIDLRTRELLWRRPLGTSNELGPLGLKSLLPIPMGVPYSGGSIVTAGGLIFMGGTMDRRFRALDIRNGEVLWRTPLPNSGQATPMSYVSPRSQRQFVVLTVPASEAPEATHIAEPEAQRDTKGNEADEEQDVGGGWVIAFALPGSDSRL